MSTGEGIRTRLEIPVVGPEAIERGVKFVNSLRSLNESLRGVQLGYEHELVYWFSSSEQRMVVIPSKPVVTSLLGFKYHKGVSVYQTYETTEPFIVNRLQINGLTDFHGEPRDLEFIGRGPEQSPPWYSGDAHHWNEEYRFNPLEHQVAIVLEDQR